MTGTEKISGSVSESDASSASSHASTPSGQINSSGSSGSSSGSSEVECLCLMDAAFVSKYDNGGSTVCTFEVSALGTCDLTVYEFRTTYTGEHAFSPTPYLIPAGTSQNFSYARPGDATGDEINVKYLCESGEEGDAFFVIP